MKRSVLLALTLPTLLGLAAARAGGGAEGPLPAPRTNSDEARVPAKPVKVAVLELAVVDNSMNGDSDSLRAWMVESGIEPTGLLREALSREETYAAIHPRPQLLAIAAPQVEEALDEAGLSARECVRLECSVRIGRALAADRVITGEVTKLSVLIWFVTARVVDVRSGKVLRQDEFEVKGVITDLMPKVMVVLARRLAAV
jgi:hypothetical protein